MQPPWERFKREGTLFALCPDPRSAILAKPRPDCNWGPGQARNCLKSATFGALEGPSWLQKLGLAPPPLQASSALLWLLQNAFGPPSGPSPGASLDAAAVVRLARELGLAGRLCRQRPLPDLEKQLGLAATRELAFQQLQVRGFNRELAAALTRVREVAATLGVELVLLKHAALWTSHVVTEGQRDARDLDVLVSASDANALWRALCAEGFRPVGDAGPDYHLAPLVSASGACVELHHRVWGVEVAGEVATSRALIGAGLTVPSDEASHVHVPKPELLVAHALVHGLAQHLTSPSAYAPLRALGDLVALAAFELEADRIAGYIERELDLATVQAALAVSKALARGEPLLELDADATALLAHAVAASADRRYAMALRAHRLWELRERGELLDAAKRFFTHTSSATAAASSAYAPATLGERAREAWDLTLGLIAHVQLRKP